MARKNMFEGITPAQRSEDPEMPALPRSAAKMPEVFQSAGPIAAIRNDLRSLSSRSVQEIDPEMIEDTGLKDRLGSLDDDVAELRDSIAKHGQQVPILLRPHPTLSGRYQVVYGRRRNRGRSRRQDRKLLLALARKHPHQEGACAKPPDHSTMAAHESTTETVRGAGKLTVKVALLAPLELLFLPPTWATSW